MIRDSTNEFGLAAIGGGPFSNEREAYDDARKNCAATFVTGRTDRGWYWALEDDYVQLGGNKLIGVNGI